MLIRESTHFIAYYANYCKVTNITRNNKCCEPRRRAENVKSNGSNHIFQCSSANSATSKSQSPKDYLCGIIKEKLNIGNLHSLDLRRSGLWFPDSRDQESSYLLVSTKLERILKSDLIPLTLY